MARRRLQQRGDLSVEGGWWRLRWRIDAVDADGTVRRAWSRRVDIGPARNGLGLVALTRKEATRKAWEDYLSKLDQNQQTPQSMMTVDQFVEQKFLPGHVKHLKSSGRTHYANMLRHVLPAIGKMRLCDAQHVKEHIQALVNAILDRGLSVQTAKHVKTCCSAIFTFAESEECFRGTNPAKHVRLPEMSRKPRHSLTFDQARELLAALPETLRWFCTVLLLTSMNLAELLGLRWRYINLSDSCAYVDGEAVPPKHVAVRWQWYRGEYGTVKAKPRLRNIPLPGSLLDIFLAMEKRDKFTGPDDYVFVSRDGTPFDAHNQLRRTVKLVAALAGMGNVKRDDEGKVTKFDSWVSWHVLRHTHASWTKAVGLADFDRMRLMGHGSMEMLDRYTHEQTERQRAALDEIAGKLKQQEPEPPTGGKIVVMKRRAG